MAGREIAALAFAALSVIAAGLAVARVVSLAGGTLAALFGLGLVVFVVVIAMDARRSS